MAMLKIGPVYLVSRKELDRISYEMDTYNEYKILWEMEHKDDERTEEDSE